MFRRRIVVVVPNEDVVAPKCVSFRADELCVVRIVVPSSSSFEKDDDDEKDFIIKRSMALFFAERRSRRRRLDEGEGDLPFSTQLRSKTFVVKPRLRSILCISEWVFIRRARRRRVPALCGREGVRSK